MGRFSRGGSDRNARDRVLSSYNSNRRRILGSNGDRSSGRSFTVSRNGGDSNRRGNNNNNSRRGGDRFVSRRRGGNSNNNDRDGGNNNNRRRSGRTGTIVRRSDRQLAKRGQRGSESRGARAGKRTERRDGGSRRDGGRRLRKSEGGSRRVGGGRRGDKKREGGPSNAASMDNMLEAYQQGKNQQEIRAAGRVAQIQGNLDKSLENYQNGPASSSSNNNNSRGGNNLDNSLESYMKGN